MIKSYIAKIELVLKRRDESSCFSVTTGHESHAALLTAASSPPQVSSPCPSSTTRTTTTLTTCLQAICPVSAEGTQMC